MKDVKYKQCTLQRKNVIDVAWIPAKYAVRNKVLKIQDVGGWVVRNVGMTKTYSEVNSQSRGHLHTREVSDI